MTASLRTRIANIHAGVISPDPIPMGDPAAASPRRFVGQVMWRTRRFAFPAAIAAVVHQLGEALVPVIMGRAIDSAVVDGDLRALVFWVAVLGLNFFVFSFTARYGYWIGQLGSESIQHRLRTRIAEKLLHPKARTDRLPGSALSLATNDVRRLGMAVTLMVYPIGELAAIVFGGALLLLISWPLGLAVLLGAPLLLFVLDLAGRPLRTRAQREAEAVADAAGTAADLISGYRVLRGVRAEETATDRYQDYSQRALRAALAARRTQSYLTFGLRTMTGLFVAGIAVAAALIAIDGGLSVGELITVVALTQFLIIPLTAFASNVAPIWSAAQASARRVLEVLGDSDTAKADDGAAPGSHGSPSPDSPTPNSPEHAPTGEPPTLRLRGVVVGDHEPLDLVAEPGSVTGIRADGQLASALADALGARTAPAGGQVLLGDEPVDAQRPERSRATMLVAPHEAALFDGTITENIAVPGHRPDLVGPALDAAGCEDVIAAVSDGLDTMVGEGGLKLSGGQRQRLALARALAMDAPVLVLHEPTTAVDSVTEASIAARLRGVRAGRTTVIITSSPALLAAADTVIELAVREP